MRARLVRQPDSALVGTEQKSRSPSVPVACCEVQGDGAILRQTRMVIRTSQKLVADIGAVTRPVASPKHGSALYWHRRQAACGWRRRGPSTKRTPALSSKSAPNGKIQQSNWTQYKRAKCSNRMDVACRLNEEHFDATFLLGNCVSPSFQPPE